VNDKCKDNLFHDFQSFHDKTLLEVLNFIQIKYRTKGLGKLIELIYKTHDPESFLTDKLILNVTKTTSRSYEVFTAPIYDDYCGHLGRIWQFTDVTEQQKLDELKSDFIALSSHQLRTPLSSIRGYLDMIMQGDFGDVPEHLREALQTLVATSDEMSDLVEDLLKISRLDSEHSVSEKEVQLDALVGEVVAELNSLASAKNVEIRFLDELESKSLKTDETKLKECITNLIQNAIKYSYDGGSVTVSTKYTESGVEVLVQDHGIGIPIDQQTQVFEKFFRGTNAAQITEGTGLGLYYVQKALQALGGKVNFRSAPGIGTTFLLNLPQ
jgi:signal transduction histidine kinase